MSKKNLRINFLRKSMDDDFSKEDFLKELSTFPYWIRNDVDLMKLCSHLRYRLIQMKAMFDWYQNNFELTEDQDEQVNNICTKYDNWYNNSYCEFMPLSDWSKTKDKL